MMLHIPGVLTREQVSEMRQALDAEAWTDGLDTAGAQAVQSKRNLQLPPASPLSQRLGQIVADALSRQALFVSAALPHRILPPMFNRYEGGGHYGNHVDGAVHRHPLSGEQVRTDVSTTVFLSDPDEYDGGELVVEDVYGTHEVKLPAGDAIVYPATSLHRVEPVTRGARVASFLWTQSMVKDDWRRSMLFDLDMAIMNLRRQLGDTREIVSLTSHYHNLLRQWADL
ncbi:Fe2+-dependent dioxygenase [Noviherbaspirillum sp.]|uniref:Fe2+-dependent dioxygenase n=1 Tax=Noviherbaspirillum sp. TaxID=1926288 RepID=UPI002D3953E7|nr:Fe2+-dependent dioxygenase [Noviherbaspirillum sp.]HZW20213.1 Fe2+-dependent dioxygenase [Noviherbaspirillum sp.]